MMPNVDNSGTHLLRSIRPRTAFKLSLIGVAIAAVMLNWNLTDPTVAQSPEDRKELEFTPGGIVRSNTEVESVASWTGTLTVGVNDSQSPPISGFSSFSGLGSLSDNPMELDGASYPIQALLVFADGLYFATRRDLPGDFTLTVDGEDFVGRHSRSTLLPAKASYWWGIEDPGWSEDDEVDVEITFSGRSLDVDDREKVSPTAYFEEVPAQHNGVNAFTFDLRFQEEMSISHKTLRDHTIVVSNGRVTKAKRFDKDSNKKWHVTVRPDGPGEVTIALTAGLACDVDGAICADDGRRLYNSPSVRVPGPITPTDEAGLSDLSLSGVSLSPTFNTGTKSYSGTAVNTVSQVTVDAEPIDENASVAIQAIRSGDAVLSLDDEDADDGTAGHQVDLSSSGDTLIIVSVTSSDGSQNRTYVVTISKSGNGGGANTRSVRSTPSGTTLSALSLTGVTISPTFASATTAYTASVAADVGSVTVSATAADSNSDLLFLPPDSDSGTSGNQVALAKGVPGGSATTNTVAVIVRSSDGTKLGLYVITVTRAAPAGDDATLSSLSVSDAALRPSFKSNVYAYWVSVGNTVDQATITPVVSDDDASFEVTPEDADTNTEGHQVDLDAGANTVTVEVTADDDTTTRTYTLEISRGLSNDASLSSLTLAGATLTNTFDSEVHDYTAEASSTETDIYVSAVATDSAARVFIRHDGHYFDLEGLRAKLPLKDWGSYFEVTVEAADDETTQTYRVLVGREAAGDEATLSHVGISGESIKPQFQSDTYSYVVRVKSEVDQLTVFAVPTDVEAEVEMLPADADPDKRRLQVNLAPAASNAHTTTTFGFVVTSADGTTSRTYHFEVYRAPALITGLNFELPDGCRLKGLEEPLVDNEEGIQYDQWKHGCLSILEYVRRPPLDPDWRGYALYYALQVLEDGEVTFGIGDLSPTSYHMIIRDVDGDIVTDDNGVVAHAHWDRDGHCVTRCTGTRYLTVELDAGNYVIESIQHYTPHTFRRETEHGFKVYADDGVIKYGYGATWLSEITIDGTALSNFESDRPNYRADRPSDGVATVGYTTVADAEDVDVTIYPADSDSNTEGHQIAVAATGLTEAWIYVVDSEKLLSDLYRLQFFGGEPSGPALTGEFDEVPATHNGTDEFQFKIRFTEYIFTSYRYIKTVALDVTGGTIVKANRIGRHSDNWRIIVQPNGNGDVTIGVPATTSCNLDSSICTFFGKRLSQAIPTETISGPGN